MLLVLPNLFWEMHRGWPTMALLRTVIGTKYCSVGPWDYIWQQSLLTHPFCAPIWLAGLWFFFADPCGKTNRVLGWLIWWSWQRCSRSMARSTTWRRLR